MMYCNTIILKNTGYIVTLQPQNHITFVTKQPAHWLLSRALPLGTRDPLLHKHVAVHSLTIWKPRTAALAIIF